MTGISEITTSGPDLTDVRDPEKRQEGIGSHLPDTVTPSSPVSNWQKPLTFYLAYISLLLMVFLVSVDSTAIAVAIPSITSELSGTTLEAFWASISFTLAVVVVQPIYTSLSDVLGRKLPLYAACLLFGLGSIVFAVAKSMSILILGRVLQGLGGGGLDVLNEVIVADITTLKERPLWIGLFGIPMAVGCIMGPVIGALFSENADWRWIGWINLPVLAVAALLAATCLRLKPREQSLWTQLGKVDWIGMTLFTAGCTAFALPLSWAGAMYTWSSWQTILPLVLGVVTLGVLALYEAKPENPVFPYRIFGSPTAQATLIGGFIHGMVLYALLLYVPLFFQAVYLADPLRSAVLLIPLCATLVVFCTVSAVLVDYVRRYLWEIWLSWVLLAVGVGLMALWSDELSVGLVVGTQIIVGMALGTLFTVPSISMQASAPRVEDQGLAIGILVSFRLFGALMGLAIGATTFSSIFARSIADMGPLPKEVAVLADASVAIDFIHLLPKLNLAKETLDMVRHAYLDAMKPLWYIFAGFSGLGLFISFWVKELSIETEEVGTQHLQGSV